MKEGGHERHDNVKQLFKQVAKQKGNIEKIINSIISRLDNGRYIIDGCEGNNFAKIDLSKTNIVSSENDKDQFETFQEIVYTTIGGLFKDGSDLSKEITNAYTLYLLNDNNLIKKLKGHYDKNYMKESREEAWQRYLEEFSADSYQTNLEKAIEYKRKNHSYGFPLHEQQNMKLAFDVFIYDVLLEHYKEIVDIPDVDFAKAIIQVKYYDSFSYKHITLNGDYQLCRLKREFDKQKDKGVSFKEVDGEQYRNVFMKQIHMASDTGDANVTINIPPLPKVYEVVALPEPPKPEKISRRLNYAGKTGFNVSGQCVVKEVTIETDKGTNTYNF